MLFLCNKGDVDSAVLVFMFPSCNNKSCRPPFYSGDKSIPLGLILYDVVSDLNALGHLVSVDWSYL